MVRDEERNILEWLAFQKAIGFDAVIFVNHKSTDATMAIANKASAFIPMHFLEETRSPPKLQERVYLEVCERFKDQFDWIAFIDSDEFIVNDAGLKIAALLEHCKNSAAIAVPWIFFGSSGLVNFNTGLVIEDFVRRSNYDFNPNELIKTIVRPERVKACPNSHCFVVDGPYTLPDGSVISSWKSEGRLKQFPAATQWRVNHYYTRSQAHWQQRMKRGQLGEFVRTMQEFKAYDRNEVEDRTATKYAGEVKLIMRQVADGKLAAPESNTA
jgi:glycosyltransferase involved in cell wall biosynthesis